jgi:hypothetical protein
VLESRRSPLVSIGIVTDMSRLDENPVTTDEKRLFGDAPDAGY